MKKKFTVALIGRPNVGKSSLFNALVGFRRTIVFDAPGTTRDIIREHVRKDEAEFDLLDSQGLFEQGDVAILDRVTQLADAIIFVVDGSVGCTPFDRWIATYLHQAKLPVLVCINKTDRTLADGFEVFAELRFEDMIEVAAVHKRGFSELLEWIGRKVNAEEPNTYGDGPDETISIAIVGRPNTGKSTLMNRLCGETVSQVSPEAHTTRDPVGFDLMTPAGKVRLLDTAGVRRPRSKKDQVEIFSIQASTRMVHAADVVLLMIASHEPITDQDMRLLNLIEREGKPTVILLNFWDRLSASQKKEYVLDSGFDQYVSQFKVVPISARMGTNVERCMPAALRLWRQSKRRIPTAKLNRLVEKMIQRNPPPTMGRRTFNILYASQVKSSPPTFLFFMNRKASLPEHYRRYLENSLRSALHLQGQPLRLFFRGNSD